LFFRILCNLGSSISKYATVNTYAVFSFASTASVTCTLTCCQNLSYEIKLPNVTKRLYGSTALHNEPLTGISDKQYSKHILQKYYILSRISCEINYNYKSMINCVEVPLNSNQPKWLSHRQITHITNVTNHHVGFSCFEYDLYLPISALLNAFLHSERNSEMTENYDITSSLASKSRYTNNVIFHINGAMKHNVCSHCIPPSIKHY